MTERLDIKNAVHSVKVVDTHEHLMKESDRLEMQADPLLVFLPHYLSSDLVSSGMTLDDLNKIRSVDTPSKTGGRVSSHTGKKLRTLAMPKPSR